MAGLLHTEKRGVKKKKKTRRKSKAGRVPGLKPGGADYGYCKKFNVAHEAENG